MRLFEAIHSVFVGDCDSVVSSILLEYNTTAPTSPTEAPVCELVLRGSSQSLA